VLRDRKRTGDILAARKGGGVENRKWKMEKRKSLSRSLAAHTLLDDFGEVLRIHRGDAEDAENAGRAKIGAFHTIRMDEATGIG